MNGILALLLSMGFYVETVIGTHPSLLASLPHLSGFKQVHCSSKKVSSSCGVVSSVPCLCCSFYVPQVTCMENLKKRQEEGVKMLGIWGWPC